MKRKDGRYAKKNNTKRWLIVLGVLTAVLLIELVFLLVLERQNAPSPEQTTPPVEIAHPAETDSAESEALISTEPITVPTEAAQTNAPTEEPEEPDETKETDPPIRETEPPRATNPPQTDPPARETQPPRPTNPPEPDNPAIRFPYAIPNTELVVRYVNSYSGIFMEDGSDRDVKDISAMVVTNQGKTAIEYATIYITQNGKELSFKLSALPAGATIVVQEAGAASYEKGEYFDCWCEIAEVETLEMSENQVQVEENEDGSLLVTNLTDKTIPTIRIFYKYYMYDEEVYVCGITYTAKIQDLKGGASCVIAPSHYLADASKIVMVRTYDSAN